MGKRGPKPKRVANPSWSVELAYACGLMATDGCLYSDGRHLSLTSVDRDQLETFKKCLELKNKIAFKSNGSGQLGLHVQFGDVTLYKWFISIGITPRKTFTIGEVKVPDQFFWDYLRGEFDGDGGSHAYWDTRWRSSVCIYISFACASKPHLEWLHTTIQQLLGISGTISPHGSNIYYLRFSKHTARKIYEAMYYKKSLPYLKRKKAKLDRQWEAHQMALEHKQPANFIKNGHIIKIA